MRKSRKQYYKQYRLEHKEEIKEQNKQYKLEHKEEIKEQNKQYYLDNQEKIKQYRLDNQEKIKEQNKQYYLDNQEKIKQYKLEHKEEIKEQKKQYYLDNQEKIKQYYLDNQEKIKQYYLEQNKIENSRRKKLGLPLINEGFRNEMELLVIIHFLFSQYEILTHHRSWNEDWGLELDIYIPELKLAFEYNGKQHYELIEFFHTEEEFEAQQYRDRCKKKICKLKGITLIKIKYDEDLSEQLILTKINYLPYFINQRRLLCHS